MKKRKLICILFFLSIISMVVFYINKQNEIIEDYKEKVTLLNEEVGKYSYYSIEKLKGILQEIVYIDDSWNSNVLENTSKILYNNRLLNEKSTNIKIINKFIEGIAFDLRVLAVTMDDGSISTRDKRLILNVSINSKNLLRALENLNVKENEYAKLYETLECRDTLFQNAIFHESFRNENEIYLSNSYLNTITDYDENENINYTILLPKNLEDFHWEIYIEHNNVVKLHCLSSSDITGEDILIMKSDKLLKYRLELLEKGEAKIVFKYINQNGETKDIREYDIVIN